MVKDEAVIPKKMTILILPEGADHVKQFNLSGGIVFLVTLLLVSITIFSCWIVQNYGKAKAERNRLARLELENRQKEKELLILAKRVHKLHATMGELEKLNDSLTLAANTGLKGNPHDGLLQGVGGSESARSMFDYAVKAESLKGGGTKGKISGSIGSISGGAVSPGGTVADLRVF